MLTTATHLQVRRPSPTTAEFTVTTCPPATLSVRLLLGVVLVLRVLLAASVLLVLHATWTLEPFPPPDATPAGLTTATAATAVDSSSIQHAHTHHNITWGAAAGSNMTSGGEAPVYYSASNPPAPRPTTLYTTDWAPYFLSQLYRSPLGHATTAFAARLPPSLFLALSLALLYLTTLRIHTTESLLVLRGLGIQTSSTGGSYLASWRAGTRFIPTEKIRDVLINEAFRGFAVRYYLVVVVDGEEDVVVVFPRLLPRRKIVERVWRGCRGCLWEPQDGGGIGAGVRRGEEKGSYG